MELKTRTDQPEVVGDDPTQPTSPVEKPEFLQKDAPKLGVILSGGGALSYAHIGVLQELESQKVPIHALAGLGWGSLVAGAYARKNRAHAVEWQLLKLPHEQFIQKSFFSSGQQAVPVTKFMDFLTKVFEKDKFSDLELAFGCTYTNVVREESGVLRRGYVRNAVKSCWPYPPHFSTRSIAANPADIASAAQFLKSQGAEVILYVDVLSENQLLSRDMKKKKPDAALLWAQNKTNLRHIEKGMVHDVIRIALPGFQMNSYKSLRSIIRMGQVKSKSQVKGFIKKYAY